MRMQASKRNSSCCLSTGREKKTQIRKVLVKQNRVYTAKAPRDKVTGYC